MKNALAFLLTGWVFTTASAQKPSPPTPRFEAQVIDNQISIGYGLATGDVDGDRRTDILLADKKDIVWYQNPVNPGDPWKRFVMAQNLTPQDNVCIAARDLDGDGRVEVAVGAGWDPGETNDTTKSGAVFYLLRPQDPTQRWEPLRLHHEVTTHRMRWAKAGDQYQLVVVPLHGRGNKNGEGRGVRVYGYEFPKDARSASVRKPWKLHLIDSSLHMTHNFEIWEDGPRTRILLGGREGGRVLAWQNNRWQFTGTEVGPGLGMGEVRRGIAGGKSFVAAVTPMHGNQLVVLGENGPKQVLYEKLAQGHALVSGDFLKTGQAQLAVGWRMANADKKFGVRLWTSDATGQNWREFPVDDRIPMACEDLHAADLNGDGRLDLIAAGRATLNLLVYWNRSE